MRGIVVGALVAACAWIHAGAAAPVVLDLTRGADLAKVGGQWRVKEASVVPVAFRAAGADGQPGPKGSSTYDIEPQAGWVGFDDAAWPVVAPGDLSRRLGGGKLSFVWYRLLLTLPETLDGVPVAGSSVVFTTSVDDAAEVWVDGELRRCPGQAGGAMVAGWNAVNRLVVARRAVPGRAIQLAVFGINGPLSGSPTNYVWMRQAGLELVPGGAGPEAVSPACEENIAIERFDDRLDAIVSRNPKLFLIAEGFDFTEGPVWDPAGGGALLFSDPNRNRIYRWSEKGGLSVFREPSGYSGGDVARYRQPGSNGLAIDPRGRLTFDQHGNRRVVRLEADGHETVLAERFGGKRLNSPNDLVYRSDGTLYFTDPYFGLPGFADDPAKELPFQGVYRIVNGKVDLLTRELAGPNGLAFSPDEAFLYVGDWDDHHKAVMRYPVLAEGHLGAGEPFVDFTGRPGEDAIDGVKTDTLGNVYVSGPGGVWIVAPDKTILGLVRTPRHVHNLAWGEDGTVLYLAARDHLYRMPLRVRGHAPHLAPAPRISRTTARFDELIPRAARGRATVIADRFQGKRLNSPNDAIVLPNGEIWFTDPPFGLPDGFDDSAREIPYQGVYRITASGEVKLLTSEVPAPNGLALSADGATLYVSNAEPERNAVVYAFDVRADATLGSRRLFADLTKELNAGAPGAPDGIEVDAAGRVWLAGPGGVHTFTPEGRRLGRIEFERPVSNLEFGGDGFLYVTADTTIWRFPLTAP